MSSAAGGPATASSWLEVVAELGVDRQGMQQVATAKQRAHVDRWVGGGIGVDVAQTPDACRRIRLEGSRRRWALQAGVAVPRIVAEGEGGAWMVSCWVEGSSLHGRDRVEAALESAKRIAAAPDPPGSLDSSSWRASRRSLPLRVVRLTVGGMPIRLWRAARSQALGLPREQTAHNDFHARNVIPSNGTVYVVDWEHAGRAPRYADALRLWSTLTERKDRELVMESVLSDAPRSRHRDIGALLLWLSLRQLGENLSIAPARRVEDALEHPWAVIPEASEWARRLGAWPL